MKTHRSLPVPDCWSLAIRSSRSLIAVCCLSLALITGLPARPARAEGGELDELALAQLYALAAARPIGTVESSGELLINGRAARGAQLVWDGELVQAAAADARVLLAAVGQVRLPCGAAVRLQTVATAADAVQTRRALIASLVSGEIAVELEPQAGAFVQVGKTVFAADAGAIFHADARGGAAAVMATRGEVRELGGWAIRFPLGAADSPTSGATVAASSWPLLIPAQIVNAAANAARQGAAAATQPFFSSLKTGAAFHPPSSAERPLFYAPSLARPLGAVAAAGGLLINGRVVRGQQSLWAGELLEALAGTSAHITIEQFGQVTLKSGAAVRLATVLDTTDGAGAHRTLIIAVAAGEVGITLQPAAEAYVQAGDAAFAAAAGARFNIDARGGQAMVAALDGDVREISGRMFDFAPEAMAASLDAQQTQAPAGTQRRYNVRPVDLGYQTSVRARSTRQIQIRVTDENDRPVPDLPVLFLLSRAGGQPIAAFDGAAGDGARFQTNTNTQGIAQATLNASGEFGTSEVRATVAGTNSSWNGLITVVKATPGFWSAQNAVPVFAVAAAAVAAGVTTTVTKDDRGPVRAPGSPIIRP